MADKSIDEITEPQVESLQEHFLRRGQLFIASSNITFSGTSFEKKILIRNPVASGVNLIIFRIGLSLDVAATTGQLNQIVLRGHKNPTITTEGSTVITRNLKTDASDITGAKIFKDPTISANGDKIGETSVINSPLRVGTFIIGEGDDHLTQIRLNDSNNDIIFSVVWAEDNI